MTRYSKPFTVRDGRIVDARGLEVRLWGVNYYAPFNHNYVNLSEMGIDHLNAIDRDIADFQRMGIQLVRMHLYDREISDMDGNVVDNDHLRVFDYLVNRLQESGIYLMLTPIVWWSTVETQVTLSKRYAFWDLSQNPAFGFSNFYPKHCLMWNENALACQERYLTQLFERANRFSGKRLSEYDNLVVVEVINEPGYPTPEIIRRLEREKEALLKNPLGRQEAGLLDLYGVFLRDRRLEDSDDAADSFCALLVSRYIERMSRKVEEFFGHTVITTHIHYGYRNPHMHACLAAAPVDCISVSAYVPNNFESMHNDLRNFMGEVRKLRQDYQPLLDIPKGLIAYEFNSPSTLKGYPLAAIAYMMASMGVQIAANFTYTPVDVAAYNPGWLVHYLSMLHTPNRAAAFIAAGEIFRTVPRGAAIPESDRLWRSETFSIDADSDRVVYRDADLLVHSTSLDASGATEAPPARIVGRGNSPYVRHEGTGAYFLERASATELHLTVLPDQWYVNDPYRGRMFRTMANRYIDTAQEPVVSRLREKGSRMRVCYPGFEQAAIEVWKDGGWRGLPENADGFQADPGRYRLSSGRRPAR